MKIIKELIPYVIIIIVVVIIRSFIITPIIVRGTSMNPTLIDGEVMILKKFDKSYNRFDIVVIGKEVEGDNLIKRIIGLPGETVRYKNNKLYINDEIVDDPYNYKETNNFQEVTLKDDEYFLLGDNREVSLDSRRLGPIKYSEIEGTVGIALYPFSRFGYPKK